MIDCLYEPFKKWSESGEVWLLSDPHFDDADTMNENPDWMKAKEYVEKINSILHKNDTLVCLGDCGDTNYFQDIICKRKILIKGNHDEKEDSFYNSFFDEVYDGPLFISDKILLSHEPVYGLTFCVNIHGHMHTGKYEYTDDLGGRHLNVASSVTHFEMRELSILIEEGLCSNLTNIHKVNK